MASKKYEVTQDEAVMVAEPSANYGITIPVTVPTMGGNTAEKT